MEDENGRENIDSDIISHSGSTQTCPEPLLNAGDRPSFESFEDGDLKRPLSREVVLTKNNAPLNLEAALKMRDTIKFYSQELFKSVMKVGANRQHEMLELDGMFGIAQALIPADIPKGGMLVPCAYEAFQLAEMLVDNQACSLIIIGDSTDGIIFAHLAMAKVKKAEIDWLVIRETLAYEGTKRNYLYHSDAAHALDPDRVWTLNLCTGLSERVSEINERIQNNFPGGVVDTFVVNATGVELLENVASINEYETVTRACLWAQITKKLAKVCLKRDGNMAIRTSLIALTRSDCFLAIADLVGCFENCRLFAPALGLDTGIVYILLENYFGQDAEVKVLTSLKGCISIDNQHFMKPEVFDFLRYLAPFLEESVTYRIRYVNWIRSLTHTHKDNLQTLASYVRASRDEEPDYKPRELRQLANELCKLLKKCDPFMAIVHNWHNLETADHRAWISHQPLYSQLLQDKRMILIINVHRALRIGRVDPDMGIEALNTLMMIRSENWDCRNLLFVKLGEVRIVAEWLDQYVLKQNHNYDIIWSSRWCLSAMVACRAILKTIMMENSNNLDLGHPRKHCDYCSALWNNKEQVLEALANCFQNKDLTSFNDLVRNVFSLNNDAFHYTCFMEDFTSFATLSDLKCAHNRGTELINILQILPNRGSLYVCGFSILSRFDAGVVYLLASLFEQVHLIGNNNQPKLFGILFVNLRNNKNLKSALIGHINKCIRTDQSEVVEFEDADHYLSNSYLNLWNSHVLVQAIRTQEQLYRLALL